MKSAHLEWLCLQSCSRDGLIALYDNMGEGGETIGAMRWYAE